MKKSLLFFVMAALFVSCQKASSPKETAQAFLKAMYTADVTTASTYVSTESKAVLNKAKTQTGNTLPAEESFQFATLAETVNDQTASVKNELITVPLVKEDDGWKVALTEDLLNEVQNREALLSAVKTKWDALLKEYEGRTNVAKAYITYRNSQGALSPQAKTLSEMLNNAAAPAAWTKESLLAYVQKQKQLDKAIDGALEPSKAANSDLTMNYFLQFSNAADRIKSAEGAYQLLAEKAHSPVYVPLSGPAATSLQVNAN